MSAIAGIVCFDGRRQDRAQLEALTAPSPADGIDAVGYWQDEAAALGRALAAVTPDALTEHQPLRDSASGCVIVFDGRLDNRADLRSGLADYGRLLSQQTDAAYALAGYLHWGSGVPDHLLGDYAFAVWDPRSQQLLLARDPLGTRPCYYSLWDNRLTFASTLEQMLQDPTLPRDLDEAGLLAYLNRDHSLLGRQTCYRHIQSLPGGHRLIARQGRIELAQVLALAEAAASSTAAATEADVEEFQALFTEAVRCRLQSSKPVGLMLSGGLDSSAIACVAGTLQETEGSIPARAYSIVFDQFAACDEREYSAAVASRSGLSHTLVPADDCWGLSHLLDWLPVFTDPLFLPYNGTHFRLLNAAREDGIRVMLMGHGGDHLLTGTARYFGDLLLQGRWKSLREQVSARATLTRRSFARVLLADALAPLAPPGVKRLLKRPRRPAPRRWMPAELQRPQPADRLPRGGSGRNAWWYELRGQWDRFGQDPNQAYLDRTMRLFGMELRQPFLDVRLVNFVLRAPPEAVYRNGTTKMLLRDALRDSLPPLVRDRRHRTGMSPLIETGLRQHRRAFVEALLEDSELERRGYVLPGPWKSAIQTFLQGDNRDFWSYWRSLTLEMWLRVQVGRLPELM